MIQTWLRSTIVYRSVSGMTFTCGKALRSVMYPVMGEYTVMFLIGSPVLRTWSICASLRSHNSNRRRVA